jgi:hypothetical protein
MLYQWNRPRANRFTGGQFWRTFGPAPTEDYMERPRDRREPEDSLPRNVRSACHTDAHDDHLSRREPSLR